MADSDDLLAQSNALHAWLAELPDAAWATPSVLPGCDVRTLVGHVLLVHVGLLRCLDRPTTERPLPMAEFVRRYRRDVDQLDAATRDGHRRALAGRAARRAGRGPHRRSATRLAGELPRADRRPGRGPTTMADFLITRVVELVVHADDLSRSVPEREPVPLGAPAAGHRGAGAGRDPGRAGAGAFGRGAGAAVRGRAGIAGPRHTRGTPPNVVETDPLSVWLPSLRRPAAGVAVVADAAWRRTGRTSRASRRHRAAT